MVLNSRLVRPGWRSARRVLRSRVVTALTVPHGVDRYLGLVNPLWSVSEVRAMVTRVTHHTTGSVSLSLRPNGNWESFRAGQHVRFAVEIDGARRTRYFSIASAEGAEEIEITAKVNPSGIVSRYLKEHARPGLMVVLSQPEGDFVLPADPPEHLLLISGGSGITPVMSLLRTLIARRHSGRITFLHYARTRRDVIYRAELAAIAAANPRVKLVHVTTREPGGLDGRFGRVHLLAAAPGYPDAATYACGPPSLLAGIDALWSADGIGDRLRIERFTLGTSLADTGNAVGEVRFARSGITVPNDGRTLLAQAEAAGLRPEYGCRMGVCHTCASHKISGEVRDVRNGMRSAEPEERVQLCVNVPCGDVELDL